VLCVPFVDARFGGTLTTVKQLKQKKVFCFVSRCVL